MQDVITINNYAEFEQKFDNVMQETAEKFVVIGYMLKVARDTDILRESGYSTMGEFAQKRYGLTKDIASRYIAINDRYSEGGYSEQLDPKYKTFGYAKLAEMLTLPDTIVGEISPEMTREDIRGIKNEVAEEKNISDIEAMIEEKDQGVEAEETIVGKVLYQICHENPNIFEKLWIAVNEYDTEVESLQVALAPSGVAMLSCRIPGTGRLMLSVKDIDENLKIINLRSNEKEEIKWEELQYAAKTFLQTDAEDWKIAYWNTYNEEIPEEKTEVAPAQPKAERVVKAKKPETQKKTTKKEPEKVESVAVQEEQLPGQMEVADYPELMPERTEEENECNDGNTGRNPESISGSGEQGKTNDKGHGLPADEQKTPQSNKEESTENLQEESPKTIIDTLREIAELEKVAVAENESIRRKFMAFSRGRMPIGELELTKEHAEKVLETIEKIISIKRGQ